MPESIADQYLIFALEWLYASMHDLGNDFLRQSLLICRRIEEEGKLLSPQCGTGYPLNKGILLRTRAYCSGLLGEPCSISETLIDASRCFETWCLDNLKGTWDDQVQLYYLGAVRMALIAGDIGRSQQLLKKKNRFSKHSEQHRLLTEFVERNQSSKTHIACVEDFEMFFDKVRDPHYKPPVFSETAILRLEIGLLWDKFVATNNDAIDWQRAVRRIA